MARRMLLSVLVAAALAAAPAARAATVEVVVPDRAAAASVPVRGGTAAERRAVRTALALLGPWIRIRSIAFGPARPSVGRGRQIVIDIGRPPGPPPFRIGRYEAGWQAYLVAAEARRRLPLAARRLLRWLEVVDGGGTTLRGRTSFSDPPASADAARIAEDTATAVAAAGFADVHVRALPIDGVSVRVAARATEAQLVGPQGLHPAWGERSISRFVILRRPDGTPYEASFGARALSSGSWWSGDYPGGRAVPVPEPWRGPLVLRAVVTRTVFERSGLRTVRTVRNLTCPAGGGPALCDVVRHRRWDLFAPVELVCSPPMMGGSADVVLRLGATTVRRSYDACTGGQVAAWRAVLGLDDAPRRGG